MRKRNNINIGVSNLDGFLSRGARFKSKENIPTGHFELDFALHYGQLPSNTDLSNLEGYDPKLSLGLPLGRLVELYGEEGAGKSSLAHRLCAMAQKKGHEACWIDTEHSFEEGLAELNGIDLDRLFYSEAYNKDNPNEIYWAEDILDKVCEIAQTSNSTNIKVIVLDSVANLVPSAIAEQSANKETIGMLARVLSKTMGKIAQYASIHGVLIVFINQLREKPGVMFGPSDTTPGGRALKFNASVRLKLTKRSAKDSLVIIPDDTTTSGERIVGRKSGMIIEKNRLGKPLLDPSTGRHVVIDIPIYYEPYFPEIEEVLFNSGRQTKLISVRKGVFSWTPSDESLGSVKIDGIDNFITYIRENSLIGPLAKDIKDFAKENNILLPPEIILLDEQKLMNNKQNDNTVEDETNEKKTTRGRKRKAM